MCFVVTCWERADLLALVCGVFCEFVTFPLVSWVRCGTWLYRFLIFATLLTFTIILLWIFLEKFLFDHLQCYCVPALYLDSHLRYFNETSYICKQSYGSCAWHIVSLCCRSVWRFDQIVLTVFNLQSGQKIAFSYITRGIIWKTNMQELWFMCMTCRLKVLYKCMKFRFNTSYCYQVIERTRNSIANDQREITPKYQKQSYDSCAWHVAWMWFTNVWSFVEIPLTVIKL